MIKTENDTQVTYTSKSSVYTIIKDDNYLDYHQKTDLSIAYPDGENPQTWQQLVAYLDTKL